MAIFKNLNLKSEKIMEVSKDSLKFLRDEVGMCENSSNMGPSNSSNIGPQ